MTWAFLKGSGGVAIDLTPCNPTQMRNEPGGAGLILSERRGARFAAWWEDGAAPGGICRPSGQADALPAVRQFTGPEQAGRIHGGAAIEGLELGVNVALRLEFTVGIGNGNEDRFAMDIAVEVFDGTSSASRAHKVNSDAAFSGQSAEPRPGDPGLCRGGFQRTQAQRVTAAVTRSPKPYGLGIAPSS